MLKKLLKSFLLFIVFTFANAEDINVDKLLNLAKTQDRAIMFFHHIPGCPYCKRMVDENFKDTKILSQIDKHFIYVDIYTARKQSISFKEFKGTPKEFSAHIGAVAYPSTIFMSNTGEILYKSIGYRNIDELLAEMSYISTKNYKNMSLESYIEKLEFEKE